MQEYVFGQGRAIVDKRVGGFFASLCLVVSVSYGLAAADSTQRYNQRIRPGRDGNWIVDVMGARTDHPARVQGLAQLFAAQHVISKGFSHFSLLDNKKSVKCKISKEFGTVEFGVVVVGNVFVGRNSAGNGFIDARAFVHKNRARLLAEPSEKTKREVESRLISECTARQKIVDGLY